MNKIIQLIRRLFCKHEWEDGSHLPLSQSFVCKKCGKNWWLRFYE